MLWLYNNHTDIWALSNNLQQRQTSKSLKSKITVACVVCHVESEIIEEVIVIAAMTVQVVDHNSNSLISWYFNCYLAFSTDGTVVVYVNDSQRNV